MNRMAPVAAALAVILAGSAQAGITVTLSSGNNATFNNNPVGAMTGFSSAIYDGKVGPIEFMAGSDTTGVTLGTFPGVAATPAGDNTNYLWGLVEGTTVWFGSMAAPVEVTSFRINWGSIDALSVGRYDNVLTLSNGHSVTGSDLVAWGLADGLGDQFSARDNRWFLIRSDQPFSSFTVFSPNNAFEFDMTVPEPGTWAMLIAGFGLVGAAMRRQRRAAVASA